MGGGVEFFLKVNIAKLLFLRQNVSFSLHTGIEVAPGKSIYDSVCVCVDNVVRL